MNRFREVVRFSVEHRKMLFIALSILIIFNIIMFHGVKGEDNTNAATVKEKYFTCIEIEDGDTLWGIAEEYASVEFESYDTFIDEVKSINNLKGDRITSGGTLVIPIYK